MLLVHYQKRNSSGKTVRSGYADCEWVEPDYSSFDSALRPKSASSPSDAMPPPASEE